MNIQPGDDEDDPGTEAGIEDDPGSESPPEPGECPTNPDPEPAPLPEPPEWTPGDYLPNREPVPDGPQIERPSDLPPGIFAPTPSPVESNPGQDLPTYPEMNPNTDPVIPNAPPIFD